MTKQRKVRISYTKEFKQDAVKMIQENGYSIVEVGRNLGVCPKLLSKWKKEIVQADSLDIVAMKLELKRLRKENKRLEMEREILKKAAAFFASESK